jgi:hypothetical protein
MLQMPAKEEATMIATSSAVESCPPEFGWKFGEFEGEFSTPNKSNVFGGVKRLLMNKSMTIKLLALRTGLFSAIMVRKDDT